MWLLPSSWCRRASALQNHLRRTSVSPVLLTGLPVPPSKRLASTRTRPRRALLFVPGSNPRMLAKANASNETDALIFDLEDSVAAQEKKGARGLVLDALNDATKGGSEKFVRINAVSTGLAADDLKLQSPNLEGIVIPKVNSSFEVLFVEEIVRQYSLPGSNIRLLASIESPLALMNLREIATCSNHMDALIFASEDYCAASNIIRTRSRNELLFARSSIVTAAKAFQLDAIDMVCISFKDMTELGIESRQGRELGFDGKLAVHPTQVETIQNAFRPSEKEIARAQNIIAAYELASSGPGGAGACTMVEENGTSLMIDAPMLLQAQNTLAHAGFTQ